MHNHNEVTFPLHAARGAAYLTAPNIAARHAFSTRLGGVSTGVLESLNLSVRRGDTPENVRENWRRLGVAAGLDLTRAVYAQQVHSAEVRIAHAADAQPSELEPRFTCDGFVTNEPGVPLAVFMADCLPAAGGVCPLGAAPVEGHHGAVEGARRCVGAHIGPQKCISEAKSHETAVPWLSLWHNLFYAEHTPSFGSARSQRFCFDLSWYLFLRCATAAARFRFVLLAEHAFL